MAVMSAFIVRDPKIDANKCIRLSIVHDMGESIIGDITPHDDVPKTTKAAMEFAAIEKLTSLLPGASGEELLNLFVEYEEGKTPEAKIVKHLDRFDMIQQAYEYEQSEKKPKYLQEFFDATATFFDEAHPIIKDLVEKLHAAREANTPFSQ
jgi:putative hydrolase of HD superfamily